MSEFRTISYAVALVGMIACLVAGPAGADGSEDFAKTSEAWEVAYNAGEFVAVAALYTKDGMAMPPNSKAAKGREAIAALVEQFKSANPGKLEIEVVKHGMSGELGFARGTYAVMDADGNTVDQGKWIEVRKMVDGKWYIQNDIWNSDLPLPSGD